MRKAAIAFVCALGLLGCGGGGSSEPPDAAVDAFFTKCGMPGDQGNEMGIGKFCASLGDCTVQTAPLCSILGDKDTHFCTKICQSGGPTDQCGTNAQCTCNSSNQCGCTPSACLN